MMNENTILARNIIAALFERPRTAAELADALGVGIQTIQSALRDLIFKGSVERLGDRRRDGHKGQFALTTARAIAPQAMARTGEWKGTDWTTATLRPGCLDHERVPSRRGDERVPYQGPTFFATGDTKERL